VHKKVKQLLNLLRIFQQLQLGAYGQFIKTTFNKKKLQSFKEAILTQYCTLRRKLNNLDFLSKCIGYSLFA